MDLHSELAALNIYFSHSQTTDQEDGEISLFQSVSGAQIPYLYKTVKLPACSVQRCVHYLPMNQYLESRGQQNMALTLQTPAGKTGVLACACAPRVRVDLRACRGAAASSERSEQQEVHDD